MTLRYDDMTLANEVWSERGDVWTTGSTGETTVAVVCCLHGDEPCGKRAVERLLAEYGDVEGAKFVLANPRAYERGERYVEADLNRTFPGDPDADTDERRLAPRVLEELRGHVVLDVHATESRPTPFALFHRRTDAVFEAARNTGIERVIDIGFVEGGLIGHVDGVSVEFDRTDPEGAAEGAYRTTRNFLANYGLIDAEPAGADPVVYRVYDEIPKEREGFELLFENFERVGAGEVFARDGREVIEAGGTFYPVLTSEEGYEDIYGFEAEQEGRLPAPCREYPQGERRRE
jgi:predicted deacylase